MNAFLKELRHGRVYRAAVSYAVVSWLILQLAAIVGPALGLPSWTLSATIGVLLCGFTAVLWIGWVQDHRRLSSSAGAVPVLSRRHHFLFAVLSGLPAIAVAAGFLLLHRAAPANASGGGASGPMYGGFSGPGAVVSEKSIAVLPFESFSDDKSNAYFAEGIQDEILTDLAKVADLKVISRTSVLAFGPDQAHTRNVRQIGLALGVAHLLEGSVQKAAGRVRVTAQLIDARTDLHLWAERYDRDLSDVFAIQTEMAERIVASLRARLSPGEKAAIDVWPTADPAAYDLYLQAKELVNSYAQTADWRETLLRSVRLLDEAIAHDERFALAYCEAAKAHDQLFFSGVDSTPARLAMEQNAVDTALRLQPELGEAHLASALLQYHGKRDYAATRRELAIAAAAMPNNAEVFSLTSYLARRAGRWQDALTSQNRALSLDPRNFTILLDQTVLYDMLRMYRDEIRAADAAAAALPGSADYYRLIKASALLSAGQTRAARSQLDLLPAVDNSNGAITYERVCAALYEGRPAEAASVLAAFKGSEYPGINALLTPRAWLDALVDRAAGDDGAARAALLEARGVAEANMRQQPDDPAALAMLGQIDAGLGRKDDALREGRRAVELRPISADAMDGPGIEGALALIYAWTGDAETAMAHLATLERTPGGPDFGQLRFDPAWSGLRDRPDFKQMLVRLDPHLAP